MEHFYFHFRNVSYLFSLSESKRRGRHAFHSFKTNINLRSWSSFKTPQHFRLASLPKQL